MSEPPSSVLIHPSACVDAGCVIGEGTRIWHFCHVMAGAASGAKIGSHVKIQNNVSVYAGVELEDEVFCGPSCVFTNVKNPRSEVPRQSQYETTRVRRGATLSANATLLCGADLGRYSLVG